MVTPVISSIAPFDAEVGTVVNFTYTGGITNSYIEIFNIGNELIYDSRNDARVGISQLKQRVIPSATEVYVNENGEITSNPLKDLANDAQYYIRLTVENDGETATSQKKLFRCITTPTLSVYCNDGTNKPLGNSYTLETATFELYADYTQVMVDGKIYEDLNSYQFILYDNNFQVIYTSDVYYNLLGSDNKHVYIRINGLEQKRYFLKVMGRTVNGYLIDNDLITVDVEYKSNTQKTTLYVENCHEEGLIKIGTNIHALLYRLGKSPADFMDDEIIDLKDNWLEYYDGLSIIGDYVAYFRFKNAVYNTNLVRISGNGHNVYMNCYKHNTYMSMVELEETYGEELPNEEIIKNSELYFDLRIYTNDKVEMLVSDRFSVEDTQDEYFNAFIARVGSVYSFLVLDDKGLIVYNMTYELDGGENDARNPITYKEDDTLTLYAPSKLGHTFLGWYSDKTYTNEVASTFTALKGDMTLYAKWKANVYNIVYVDGGSVITPTTYTYGEIFSVPTPTKSGYNFICWSTDKNFTEEFCFYSVNGNTYFPNTLIGDITLYAKWEPIQYTITYTTSYYNATDGTITSSADNPTTYYAGDSFELSDAILDDNINYQFDGWYTNSSCSDGYKITSVENCVGNLNLYAKLSPKYCLKYTWREDDSISGNLSGWIIQFTSLASGADSIHIPALFNGEEVIGFVNNTTTAGLFLYNNANSKRLVKSTVRFTVDEDSKLFEADVYGNLFLKKYTYTNYNIYNPNGTNTQAKTLLSYNDSNIFNSSMLNGVTLIGCCAFYDCINLTTIVIPENIIALYSRALYGCNNLSSIYICLNSSGTFICKRKTDTSQASLVNCIIYIKENTNGVSIDSYQTISTNYDWEIPEL